MGSESVGVRDRIGMLLDLRKRGDGSLSLFKNGYSVGRIIEGLRVKDMGSLRLVVSSNGVQESCRLLITDMIEESNSLLPRDLRKLSLNFRSPTPPPHSVFFNELSYDAENGGWRTNPEG